MTRLERDNVIDQARHDTAKGADHARLIRDPLNRGEALVWVGWMTSDLPLALRTIDEGVASLRKASPAYERAIAFSCLISASSSEGQRGSRFASKYKV